jgi:hypothetical protein
VTRLLPYALPQCMRAMPDRQQLALNPSPNAAATYEHLGFQRSRCDQGKPFLPAELFISGLVYDVHSGLVETVVPPSKLRESSVA